MVLLSLCDCETDKQFNSMCDIFSEALHTNFVFLLEIFLFLLDKLRKRCHQFNTFIEAISIM